jgi:large subunit ribosomal protein L4
VVADLKGFTQPSAKSARKVLADLGAPRRAVIVVAERDDNLWKSFRNFPNVSVKTAAELCAHDVVAGGLVIAESSAMDQLAARVGQQEQAVGGDA